MQVLRESLKDPAKLPWVLDRLREMPPSDLSEVSSLVFDAIKLPDEDHATSAIEALLQFKPGWANQSVHWVVSGGTSEHTLLMEAVWLNRSRVVNMLLDAGARTDVSTDEGEGLLDLAAQINPKQRNDPQSGAMVDLLLERLSFTQFQKDRALHYAGSASNLNAVNSLLAAGAGFGVVIKHRSALAAACHPCEDEHPTQEIVCAMLQTRQGLGALDHGWSEGGYRTAAVHVAAHRGNVGVLSMLIDAGAALDVPQGTNRKRSVLDTPLMAAAFSMRANAVQLLLESGADPLAVDHTGDNAFHHLATSDMSVLDPLEEAKVFNLLVSAGTSPLVANEVQNLTALDIARNLRRESLVALICAYEMDGSTPAPINSGPGQAPRF